MSQTPARKSSLLEFALIFAVAYVLSQVVLRLFFPSAETVAPSNALEIRAVDETVRHGNIVEVVLENGTAEDAVIEPRCPEAPVEVYRVEQPGTAAERAVRLTAEETVLPCPPVVRIPAGGEITLSLAPWKYAFFAENGVYELRLPAARREPVAAGTGAIAVASSSSLQPSALTGATLPLEGAAVSSASSSGAAVAPVTSVRVEIYEPGVFVKLFRTFITRPFLNILVFVASLLPDHTLGIAIIVLTILVKLLLFLPTQHSLEGQRKMQLLQPKIEAVRKKHKEDPKKLQEETMKLWKEHKINPFSSCLPLLLQFPILIGLFFVVRDGSVLELSRELLYPVFRDVDWSFGTNFLGMNLTAPSLIMPPILVALQFWQMKLSFARKKADKEKDKKPVIDAETGKPVKESASPEQVQQKVMLYALPLMIGFFAIQFPAAVSVYWGISTLFAVGQQVVVNRRQAA